MTLSMQFEIRFRTKRVKAKNSLDINFEVIRQFDQDRMFYSLVLQFLIPIRVKTIVRYKNVASLESFKRWNEKNFDYYFSNPTWYRNRRISGEAALLQRHTSGLFYGHFVGKSFRWWIDWLCVKIKISMAMQLW